MLRFLRSASRDQSGATSIETALIAALLAIAIISALGEIGHSASEVMHKAASKIAAQSKPDAPAAPAATAATAAAAAAAPADAAPTAPAAAAAAAAPADGNGTSDDYSNASDNHVVK
ncbi:MAG: Flp family type IVb pilin [Alphaproteobacteria bacterium]|nr:Flp family type IVb pilin [Alphaproteobacteria bacterium]